LRHRHRCRARRPGGLGRQHGRGARAAPAARRQPPALFDENKAKTFSEALESVFPDDVVRDDVGLPDAAAEPADARTVVRRTFG
jgi:hypothetical protein